MIETTALSVAAEAPHAAPLAGVPVALVVDDHKDTRDILCRVLKHLGYVPQGAESGAQALLLLDKGRPDVLICDIRMPGMSGIQLLREIARGGSTVPAIALSGSASPEDVEDAYAAGFLCHVVKPATIDEIEEALLIALVGYSGKPPRAIPTNNVRS